MSLKVIEEPPLSCLAGWTEVQLCFTALQLLHFSFSRSPSCAPPNCPHWAVWTVAQPAWLGSAGLTCAFYLYFMIRRCTQTASRAQWENEQGRSENVDGTKWTWRSFKHRVKPDKAFESVQLSCEGKQRGQKAHGATHSVKHFKLKSSRNERELRHPLWGNADDK